MLFGDGELPQEIKKISEIKYLDKTPLKVDYIAKKYRLTRQEHKDLSLIMNSYSSSQIAEKLVLSESTIMDRRKDIHSKLRAQSKKDIVALVNAVTDEELGI